MFTGIITDTGIIKDIKQGDTKTVAIQTNYDIATLEIGTSVACNGCCLTVTRAKEDYFEVQISPESLNRTSFKNMKIGDLINLEKSLKVGDEIAGHFVTGHIDNTSHIKSIKQQDLCYNIEIFIPNNLKKFIAQKGSITINGVSLTVNDVFDDYFGVTIIPHTFEKTNFKNLKNNDMVNLEIDILARYVLNN